MKNKEPITMHLSTVILLFIILILLFALALMYMYYNKDSKNEAKTNTNKTEVTNNTKPTEESNKKELSITSSTVKDVYNYIPVINGDIYNQTTPNAYQTKKITADDLDSRLLLAKAFDNLENNNMSTGQDLEAKKVTEQALKIYNKEIEPITFSFGAMGLEYMDGTYGFSNGGYIQITVDNICNIEEAYEENDELYIIDGYIMAITEDGDVQAGDETATLSIYNSSDSKKALVEETINREEKFDYEEWVDDIKEKYSSEFKKYKHTFKKNDNGEYYWYSSEPLDK